MEIGRLAPHDAGQGFRSGDLDLDRFFERYAGQKQFSHHVGVTYIAVEDERTLGFATVAASSIEIDHLPAALTRRLPHYPLPVLRLARLAVDQTVQGRGIGAALLHFVFELASRQAEAVGCVGILVDAKPGALSLYDRFGFVALDLTEGHAETRPAPQPLFLPIATILAARS